MPQSNYNDKDFFDLLDRPEGVVPKNKNFEATPLTLGQRIVNRIPSQHKDPERAAGHEKGLALTIDTLNDFLIPKTKTDLALSLVPIGLVGKAAGKGLKKGKRLVEKMYKAKPVSKGIQEGLMPFQRGRSQRLLEAGRLDTKDTRAVKDYDIKYGNRKDPRPPDDIVIDGGVRTPIFKGSSDNFPKIDVNDELFKKNHSGTSRWDSENIFLKDKAHIVRQKTTLREGKSIVPNKKIEDVLTHTFTVQPKNAKRHSGEVAGLSYQTRRINAKNLADSELYGNDAIMIENINFSSGKKLEGRGGPMGFNRNNLTAGEELAADKGVVKLLNQTFERLPKNSIVVFDSNKDNTMSREALLLMINSAGKMAKRIILNQTGPTKIKKGYVTTGSGKNLDRLSQEEFAEMILQKVEKANRKRKVSGKLVVERGLDGYVRMSSIRIELAAAFGIPVSQFNKFMEDASE